MSFNAEESIDEEGFKFVRLYDGKLCMEYLSYRPDRSLISRIVYEWDLNVSQLDPVAWKEYDEVGNLLSSAMAIEFDAKGMYKERIFFDAFGRELFRRLR